MLDEKPSVVAGGVVATRTSTHMSARNRKILTKVDFFLGQPSRVFDRLLDVIFFQVRIALKHLVERCPVSNLTNDHRNGYPHPTDARASPHNLGIKGNSIKHVFPGLLSQLAIASGMVLNESPLFARLEYYAAGPFAN